AYADEPEGDRVKLLLTPYRESAAGDVRRELRARLAEYENVPRVVYNQSTVGAALTFKELIRVVMPMTQWWAKLTQQFALERLYEADGQDNIAGEMMDPEHPTIIVTAERRFRLPPDLLWMM